MNTWEEAAHQADLLTETVRFGQWAQDMAAVDESKTADEWLAWLRTQLIGEHPPISIIG